MILSARKGADKIRLTALPKSSCAAKAGINLAKGSRVKVLVDTTALLLQNQAVMSGAQDQVCLAQASLGGLGRATTNFLSIITKQ